MRRTARLTLLLIALYLTFVGGSAYYNFIFPVRVFHHALITLLGGYWLLNRIQKGQGIPQTPLNLPIFAAIGVWFITSFLGLDPRMSLESTWFLLIHVLFYFVIVDLLQRGRQKQLMEVQFLLAALVVFITGIELGSWYFGWGIIPGTDIAWITSGMLIPSRVPRVALAMNISTLLAGYVAPLVTLTITWALTSSRNEYRRVLWTLAGLLGVVLFFTYSRGGWLSLIGAIGTLVLFQLARTKQITKYISPKIILAVGVVGGAGAAALIISLLTFSALRSGDAVRLDMWRGSVDMVTDSPLTGMGVGQFGRAFREYRTPELARDKLASSHNFLLNTASETGILGLMVCGWLLIAFIRTTWQNWLTAKGHWRKRRIEGAVAALVGVAVHSMVDVFTVTPVVLVILLLGAYCVVGHKTWQDEVPQGKNIPAIAGLVILILYGLGFVQIDRAHAVYVASDHQGEAQVAANLDPTLRLYKLNLAAFANTIESYRSAVELEPTWDIGWINLAALAEAQGDYEVALTHLDTARQINPFNSANLHWARLSEVHELADESEILTTYSAALNNTPNPFLPVSEFWWQTPLRQDAVEQFLQGQSIEIQYRVLSVHAAEQAARLVPENPQSAADWWVVGQHRLIVENDREAALTAFTAAIQAEPSNGDYYASLAKVQADPDLALHNLDLAQLYGTTYEYPNAIRATLIEDTELARQLQISALPSSIPSQEFTTVLYGGRPAKFDVVRSMRFTGAGRNALTPWYDIAYQFEAEGDIEGAINTFEFILENAPFESEAMQKLEELNGAQTSQD